MAGSVDVKALRDRLHASAQMAHSSRGDTGPARYPLPGFGKEVLMRPGHAGVSQNGVARHKLPPMVPSPFPSGGSSPSPRFSGPLRTEPGSAGPRPPPPVGVFPRPPAPGGLVRAAPPQPAPGGLVRAAPPQPADCGRVRPSGELLQNIMLRHQRPPPSSSSSSSSSSTTQAPPKPLTTVRPLPASQRSQVEVAPLRKPLPPEGPRPPKPRRPPRVNLEGWALRGPPPPLPPSPVRSARLKNNDGSLSSGGSNVSLPGLVSPVGPPRPPYKPSSLPRQPTSIQFDDDQDTYDDIDTLERNDTWTDSSSQHLTGGSDDDSEVYELIDEHQLELKKGFSEEKKTEVKPPQQQQQQQQEDKRQQKERQKRESELRKKFQIKGEVEVLYVAQVRQDWNGGGKLDLNVQQGDRVEILRVKNNPGGRWLARTLSGNYGYISNTSVDVDYEEVKRKVRQAQGLDASPLPPPPPDPARLPPPPPDPRLPPPPPDPPLTDDIYYDVESGDHMDSSSWAQENVVMPVDFPPPPHEVRMDPKVERDLRKRFKYEGPLTVLHTMMVDPNGIIKKPGAKDLAVAQGEILDIIQLTNDKKALCRNQYRRYGYVSRALLLPMEGDDIYDDVDTFNDDSDIYDNDNMH